jgi:hypothetical protein
MVRNRGRPWCLWPWHPLLTTGLRASSSKLLIKLVIFLKKIKINEQKWVLVLHAYFLIKCSDNRCLWHWSPAISIVMTNQYWLLCEIPRRCLPKALNKISQFPYHSDLWGQVFYWPLEMDVRMKVSNDFFTWPSTFPLPLLRFSAP